MKPLASNGCNDIFRGLCLVQLALVKVLQLTGQIAVDFLWHYGWKWLLTRVGGRSMTYQATNVSGVIRYTFSISCVTEQIRKKRLRFVKVCWTWLDLISPGRESSNSPCSLNNREKRSKLLPLVYPHTQPVMHHPGLDSNRKSKPQSWIFDLKYNQGHLNHTHTLRTAPFFQTAPKNQHG